MATAIIRSSGDDRPRLALVCTNPSQQHATAPAGRCRNWRNRPPLEREEWTWCNAYTGTAEALIVAKICLRDQLPGQPGNAKTSCTYYQGQPCRRTEFKGAQRDENYMSISAEGKFRFRVLKGLPVEEQQRRGAALREAWEERERAQKDIEYRDACARLERRKRESTAEVLRDELLTHVDGFRRTLQRCQQGEALLHDWCLSASDLVLARRQIEALEQVVREVVPVRFGAVPVRKLQVVAP